MIDLNLFQLRTEEKAEKKTSGGRTASGKKAEAPTEKNTFRRKSVLSKTMYSRRDSLLSCTLVQLGKAKPIFFSYVLARNKT